MGFFGPPNVEKLKLKKDVAGLIRALQTQKDASMREAAAAALGQIGDARAVDPLIVALKDRDWDVCIAAARSLGQMIAALGESDPELREAASRALVQIGAPAVKPFIILLGESGSEIRETAIQALVQIGAPAAELLVTELVGKKHMYSDLHHDKRASGASRVLVQIGAPAVGPPIRQEREGKPWLVDVHFHLFLAKSRDLKCRSNFPPPWEQINPLWRCGRSLTEKSW